MFWANSMIVSVFETFEYGKACWLVVSTHLKNSSQIGSSLKVGMKIQNI